MPHEIISDFGAPRSIYYGIWLIIPFVKNRGIKITKVTLRKRKQRIYHVNASQWACVYFLYQSLFPETVAY